MLILLGPDGMITTARSVAKSIRKFIHSPLWADMMKTQREIREIPTRLVREAGYDEFRAQYDNVKSEYNQVKKETQDVYRAAAVPLPADDFSILPPKTQPANDAAAAQAPDEITIEDEAEQPPKWSGLTGDHHS